MTDTINTFASMEPPRRLQYVSCELPERIKKVAVLEDGVRVAIASQKDYYPDFGSGFAIRTTHWEVQVFDTSSLQCLCDKLPIPTMICQSSCERQETVHMVAVPGNMLAVAHENRLFLLETTTYTLMWQACDNDHEFRFSKFYHLAVTPDGYVAGTIHISLFVWSPTSRHHICKFQGFNVNSMVGLSGCRLAIGTDCDGVAIFNFLTKTILRWIDVNPFAKASASQLVHRLVLFGDYSVIVEWGAYVSYGVWNETASMWNFETGEQVDCSGPPMHGAVVLSDGTLVSRSGRRFTHYRYDKPDSAFIDQLTEETYDWNVVPLKECKLAVFGRSSKTLEVLDFQDRRPRIARHMALKFLALQGIPRDVLSLIDDFAGNLE